MSRHLSVPFHSTFEVEKSHATTYHTHLADKGNAEDSQQQSDEEMD